MMTVDELIAALTALKAEHGGDVDVTVWQYGGWLDDLCSVSPAYDQETGTVVLDPEIHDSAALLTPNVKLTGTEQVG